MKTNIVRQIVLDTETTGMNQNTPYYVGHRIIEIGAVEIIDRRITNRYFHVYLNPDRSISKEAFNVHGISNSFLNDKPRFSDIANDFLNFISGSELIIHNASFDVAFLDYEFSMLNLNIKKITSFCKIIDTLKIARKLFPRKRNSLDALCDRYFVDNSSRNFHNAFVDAKLLANVFLLMTGGQISMFFMKDVEVFYVNNDIKNVKISHKFNEGKTQFFTKVIYANTEEIMLHKQYLNRLQKSSNGFCIWSNKY